MISSSWRQIRSAQLEPQLSRLQKSWWIWAIRVNTKMQNPGLNPELEFIWIHAKTPRVFSSNRKWRPFLTLHISSIKPCRTIKHNFGIIRTFCCSRVKKCFGQILSFTQTVFLRLTFYSVVLPEVLFLPGNHRDIQWLSTFFYITQHAFLSPKFPSWPSLSSSK